MQPDGTCTAHGLRVEKGRVVPIGSKLTGLALLTDLNKNGLGSFLGKGALKGTVALFLIREHSLPASWFSRVNGYLGSKRTW